MSFKTLPLLLAAVVTLLVLAVKAPADEREQKIQQLNERANHLRAEVEGLLRAGRGQEAYKLAAELQEIREVTEHLLKSRQEHGPERPAWRHRLDELRKHIVELRRTGRLEEADRAEAEARSLVEENARPESRRDHAGHEHEHGHEHADHDHEHGHEHEAAEDLERRIHHLHVAAENLEAAGLKDQAREIHARAEQLERRLHERRQREREQHEREQHAREQHAREHRPDHGKELAELHRQMGEMRCQMHVMREILQALRDRIEK